MVRKFLLIDDDSDDKEMFCEAVGAIDEEIVCYAETNGRKALEKLESRKIEKPDVIFLDVNMPIIDGWECLRLFKLNQEFRDVPVIMYSTSSQAEELRKAEQLGAVGFLTKPPDFNKLKKRLELVIHHMKTDTLQALHSGSPLFL